ncbi:MAG: DUF4291 domain-containing protein [Bradyrhizobiaceae bacterium]|nr:DUF4291 domain-containing protein [Bradyrhizobiaceae bacterium]
MNLATEPYMDQAARWPRDGRHILAYHDAETVIVYQAYRPSIAAHAIRYGAFGGDFSYARMSWIKPNFMWMMYRSGWGTKEDQEAVLGLRLRRTFFDDILARAVASTFGASGFSSHREWAAAGANSDVRLQWDPDHDPHGRPLSRRAIQLGLKGAVLEAFGRRELIDVIDMTAFVAAQRDELRRTGLTQLRTPVEQTYVPGDAAVAARLMLDTQAGLPGIAPTMMDGRAARQGTGC